MGEFQISFYLIKLTEIDAWLVRSVEYNLLFSIKLFHANQKFWNPNRDASKTQLENQTIILATSVNTTEIGLKLYVKRIYID